MQQHKAACAPCNHGCSIGVTILRISTGIVPLLSGIKKLQDLDGFTNMVNGMEALGSMSGFVGATLPYVEVILGLALILGFFSRYAAGFTALTFLLISITTGFMGGSTLQLHFYIALTALSLAFLPPSCIGVEYFWSKGKRSEKIEKIKA